MCDHQFITFIATIVFIINNLVNLTFAAPVAVNNSAALTSPGRTIPGYMNKQSDILGLANTDECVNRLYMVTQAMFVLMFSLFTNRPYPIPGTLFPITLYITQGDTLELRQSETAFQVLLEQAAFLSTYDSEREYPSAHPFIYLDCQVSVGNPAEQSEMTYYVAIHSLRGLGEYMLAHGSKNALFARIGVKGYLVGTIDLRRHDIWSPSAAIALNTVSSM